MLLKIFDGKMVVVRLGYTAGVFATYSRSTSDVDIQHFDLYNILKIMLVP